MVKRANDLPELAPILWLEVVDGIEVERVYARPPGDVLARVASNAQIPCACRYEADNPLGCIEEGRFACLCEVHTRPGVSEPDPVEILDGRFEAALAVVHRVVVSATANIEA